MDSKLLNIDFYEDGISEMEFTCLDVPIAAACGKYGRENYFYYLLQRCFCTNWRRKNGQEMKYFDCLRNLGLDMEAVYIENTEKLIPAIIDHINQDYPVLLPVSYFEMFFCAVYKRKIESHYLLVDGYIEENKIITLREELSFISANKFTEIKGLYPLRLKYDMVSEMWIRSKEVVEEGFRGKIFAIRPVKGCLIHSAKELIDDFLNNFSNENIFETSILAAKKAKGKEVDQLIRIIRRNHSKLIYAMFYLLERLLKEKISTETMRELTSFGEAYLKHRETVVSELHISCIKNTDIAFENVFEEVRKYDSKLFEIAEKISEELNVYDSAEQDHVRPLIAECIITADSCEHEVIKSPYNVAKDDESIWKSEKKDVPHWLCIELPDDTTVRELIITHHEENHKITKDFCVQISNDKRNWDTVETVENNFSPITKHRLGEVRTKYIRIYITLAALKRPEAIIRKVTILQ